LVNSAELDIVNLVRSGTLLCEVQSRNADVFSYRVLTPAGYSVIVVKKTRINDPAGRESLRREYTALQEVDSLTRGTMHDSVPQAMLLLENEGTIFLSAVPGVPFDKILRRDANVLNTWLRAFVIARMDMIGRHIGEWLSTFHTATRVEDRKHDHDSYSFELSRLISRCHSFGLSASMLNGVERA